MTLTLILFPKIMYLNYYKNSIFFLWVQNKSVFKRKSCKNTFFYQDKVYALFKTAFFSFLNFTVHSEKIVCCKEHLFLNSKFSSYYNFNPLCNRIFL